MLALVGGLALLTSALVAAAGPAAAGGAATLFASPSGTGTACTSVAPCALLEALTLAAGSGYDGMALTISLASGTPTSPDTYDGPFFLEDFNTSPGTSVTITGTATGSASSTATVLDGQNLGSTMSVIGSISVTVEDLELTDGRGGGFAGGGISDFSGALNVEDTTVSGNFAAEGGGIGGGSAPITVVDSTISGNTAADGGGGIYEQNAPSDPLTVIDSTLSGNQGGNSVGGAISSGPATVTGSTIVGNSTGPTAGGVYAYNGTITLAGSIVAGNTSVGGAGDCDAATLSGAVIADGGYNIESGTDCGFTGTGSQQNMAAVALSLGSLVDNGGPTSTMAIGSASVAAGAIPAANALCTATTNSGLDQQGDPRLPPGATSCDIGAYEIQPPSLAPSHTAITITAGPGTSLVVGARVTNASGNRTLPTPTGEVTLVLSTGLTCGPLSLTGGEASCPQMIPSEPFTVSASYTGDGVYAPSMARLSFAPGQMALAAPSAIWLGNGPGEWTLITLAYSGGRQAAGQMVSFVAGTTTLCTATTASNGSATCQVAPSATAVPGATFVATFAGNGLYSGTTSAPGTLTAP